MITIEKLRAILSYNADTGFFTWLSRKGVSRGDNVFNTRYAGTVAGRTKPDAWGYNTITVNLNGKKEYYRAHILAWFYVHGALPDATHEIDHVNRDRWDNRIANLRLVTRSQNMMNSNISVKNTSGKKGVCWDSTRCQWKVEIQKDGQRINLGRYDDFTMACEVRRQKAQELFGQFAAEG
jgi:hypothetical protein